MLPFHLTLVIDERADPLCDWACAFPAHGLPMQTEAVEVVAARKTRPHLVGDKNRDLAIVVEGPSASRVRGSARIGKPQGIRWVNAWVRV